MILYSPAEPRTMVTELTKACAAAGLEPPESSLLTERKGVDFVWRGESRWFGVQRKELHDFLASLDDGRLTKEIAQMKAAVVMPTIVLEGAVQVANGQVMVNRYHRPLSVSGFNKRLFTIQSKGVHVVTARNMAATAQLIVDFYGWAQSEAHGTAGARPKPVNDWGKLTNRDYQVHLLTGLPDVGVKTANAIIDTLGRCPLRVDATMRELLSVPGVGKVTARRILQSINGDEEAVT